MFADFLSSYSLTHTDAVNTPYVFVDSEMKEFRYLSHMVSESKEDVLAVSVASGGDVELLVSDSQD